MIYPKYTEIARELLNLFASQDHRLIGLRTCNTLLTSKQERKSSNMNKSVVTLAVIWVLSAPFTFGITNAHFRAKYPELMTTSREARNNCGFAAFYTTAGPIGLILSYFLSELDQDGLSFDCGPTNAKSY